jgi:hypothetical protein
MKSTLPEDDGADITCARLDWRKSSHSGSADSECVEVAPVAAGTVAVRDSKHPGGPRLLFSRSAWGDLLAAVKSGRLGL